MAGLTRRSFVAGGTAAAAALALRQAAWAAESRLYRDAIVIDGLGGPGNSTIDRDAPLADRTFRTSAIPASLACT